MSLSKIHFLCHKIFKGSEDGRELLELLKKQDFDTNIFPVDPVRMASHGGALGWAAYRAGQRDLVLKIDHFGDEYEKMIAAENKKKKV